jgi:hypothetical protein
MALAAGAESFPIAAGGNGAALGLLCAWAAPDLMARRRGEETESDLLGAPLAALVPQQRLVELVALSRAKALAGESESQGE